MKHVEQEEPQSFYSGSSPLALKIGFAVGAVSVWINARAASGCFALVVMPAEYIVICCSSARQHADHLDVGVRHQLRHLLQTDLGFAARYQHADAAVRPAGCEFRLRRHRRGDAEPKGYHRSSRIGAAVMPPPEGDV